MALSNSNLQELMKIREVLGDKIQELKNDIEKRKQQQNDELDNEPDSVLYKIRDKLQSEFLLEQIDSPDVDIVLLEKELKELQADSAAIKEILESHRSTS